MIFNLGKLPFKLSESRVEQAFKDKSIFYINYMQTSNRLYKIQRYLRNNLNVNTSIGEILRDAILYSEVKKTGEEYYLVINKEIRIEDQLLETLVRFITFGNLNVKGDSILMDAFTYARSRL